MTSTKEDREKFTVMFYAIHDLFKKNRIASLMDKRVKDMISFANAANGLTCELDYRYKDIRIDTKIKKRKEKLHIIITNDQYKIHEEIEIGLKDHVEKIRQQYTIINQEKFEKLLYTLINVIKMKIKPDGTIPEIHGPVQQYRHYAPSLDYVQMNNRDPLLDSLPGHQQVDTRFSFMTESNSGMRSRCYYPYNYPRIVPSHPMNLNDSQSSSQSITNASVPTTWSTQQLNIENLSPGGAPRERQTDVIGNNPDLQHQQSLFEDPLYRAILHDIQIPPSNRDLNDESLY